MHVLDAPVFELRRSALKFAKLGDKLLLLHLSDIHFRQAEIETAQDPNVHLRNELIRDAQRQCQLLGRPDAVIVSGDIAFAGAPEEFTYATDWLKELCDKCGCTLASVFVCPGNHDVVRNVAGKNLVQLVHKAIKDATNTDAEIAHQMRDPDARRLLYEGLENYNTFAVQFGCDLLPPDRTRAIRELQFADGSILRLWGVNTAFVSSSHDKPNDLFVDPATFQITRHDGVVNLVMAHHHFSWIRQARAFEDHLNTVAPIQLFGHVHTNRIDMNVDYLRLTASASNPDRQEGGWEPGYNVIELDIEGSGEARRLAIRTHVRVWQTAPTGFVPKRYKGSDVFEHALPLDSWQRPAPDGAATTSVTHATTCSEANLLEGEQRMKSVRELMLRFHQLSFSKKSEVAGRLNLLEEQDMSQPDFERFRRVFTRASERNEIDALESAIAEAEAERNN